MFAHEEPNEEFRQMHGIDEKEERLFDDLLTGISNVVDVGTTTTGLIQMVDNRVAGWDIAPARRTYLLSIIVGFLTGIVVEERNNRATLRR